MDQVASVAGRRIPVSRLEERLARFRRGPGGRHLPPDSGGAESLTLRRWLLQDLVTEAVLAHEARAAGLTADRASTDPARNELSPSVLHRLFELVTRDVTVSESDMRAYYARNRDLYRRPEARRVRHILVADETRARELMAQLAAGDDMAALARTLSDDRGSRSRGGDIGEMRRGEFAGALEDALFGAEIGAVVGPIRTEHGWHIARVEGIEPERSKPYDDVLAAIQEELLAAARARAFAEWLGRRRRALAVIEPAYEHPAHPIHGLVMHRH